MSMLTDFNGDCPLTIKNLEAWLRTIVTELDKTYEIKVSLLKTLYSKQANTTVTSTISTATFNAIVNAIKAGKELKCTDRSIGISGAKYKIVTADSYSSFEICVIGMLNGSDLQQVVFGAESLAGAIRLYKKSVTSL